MTETKDRYISASQMGDFATCPRKWWFKRIPKLPEPPKSYFTFGTVLHACAERFLLATENGRVPDADQWLSEGATPWLFHSSTREWMDGPFEGQQMGDPVDLFFEGWDSCTERDGTVATVTPNEAKHIKKVIEEAIELGILARDPAFQVERELDIQVIPGVSLTGFVDAFLPAKDGACPEIHDHKTFSKGGARFLKQAKLTSPNYIGKDQQLKTYAVVTSLLDGWSGPVVVRHNQFPKFPGRKVKSTQSPPIELEELMEHWDWIKNEAASILEVAKVEKWEDAPGPRVEGACDQYGGCPFSGICTRRETADVYLQRIENEKEAKANGPRLNLRIDAPKKRKKPSGGTPMSDIFKNITRRNAEAPAAETAPEQVTETKEAAPVATAVAEAPATAGGPAPWRNPDCVACDRGPGTGFNKQGNPCPICTSTANARGVGNPNSYVIEMEGDTIEIYAKDEAVEQPNSIGAPLMWTSGKASAQEPSETPAAAAPAEVKPKVKPKPKPKEEAPESPEEVEEAVDPKAIETAKADLEEGPADTTPQGAATKKRGRSRTGVSIFIGCVPSKGPRRDTFSSAEVLARFGAELAEAQGKDSYWELNTWDRRAALAQKVDYIVDSLAKCNIVHYGTLAADDVGSLIQAIIGANDGVEMVVNGTGA